MGQWVSGSQVGPLTHDTRDLFRSVDPI